MSKNDMVMVPRELAEAFREYSSWAANPKLKLAHDKLNELLDQPADQHHGEPVAWVYMRCGEVNYDEDIVISNTEGDTLGNGDSWVPVYTRPDPAEVEQWTIKYRQLQVKHSQERDSLRAKLAEAHALLREKDDVLMAVKEQFDRHGNSFPDRFDSRVFRWVADALSASAEPSASVERGNSYSTPLLAHIDPADVELLTESAERNS